uniref:Candida pelliculosa beta-glucosidase n=1 Tax=Wickerhamomyces anomalus TaxID=4927 RepID=Q00567_WICAO|nr:unnamed protein product [Wickerhamomyces anomalus]
MVLGHAYILHQLPSSRHLRKGKSRVNKRENYMGVLTISGQMTSRSSCSSLYEKIVVYVLDLKAQS